MGCFISKPQKIPTPDDDELTPVFSPNVSPMPRTVSISTPLVHHPPLRKGDSHHLVSLTSTTYGSLLNIESGKTDLNFREFPKDAYSPPALEDTGLKKASSSKEDDDSRKSLSPDSVINTWELMDGLDDCFEDCCAVRMIFRGFRVHVHEMDISMDSSYKKDLQIKLKGKKLSLPRVFIGGEHVGGAEEIKQLNESGELAKLLEGLPVDDSSGLPCRSCGEARFVPCPCCSGSRKLFDKASERFRRCMDCNENGLIQCPSCCTN